MQTRRDVLAAVTYLAGLTLITSCDSEPKPASTSTLFNKEEVHNAVQELDSQTGALEGKPTVIHMADLNRLLGNVASCLAPEASY
jgi:hypothetical protein